MQTGEPPRQVRYSYAEFFEKDMGVFNDLFAVTSLENHLIRLFI